MTQDSAVRSTALLAAQRRLEQIKQKAQSGARHTTSGKGTILGCRTCATILDVLNSPESRDIDTKLGIWEDLTRDGCANHEALFPCNDTLQDRQIFLRRTPETHHLYVYPNPFSHGKSAPLDAPWERFEPNKPTELISETPSQSTPRIVDPSWIDIGLLTEWLSKCISTHGDVCGISNSDDLPQILLINVQERCLEWSDGDVSYIALSYVWGGANKFMTTKAELPRLLRRGAIDDLEREGALSKTVAQVIELTRALDQRYVWIDALSVIQDAEDKHIQLNAMASIYANAILTVVAADGEHANTGFRGLKGISEPRHLKQHVAPISAAQHLVKPSSKHVWHDALLEPWSSRAWTFQEALLSRRILYFAHDSVRWHCLCARWSEESNSPDCMASHGTAEQRRHHNKQQQYVNTSRLSSGVLPSLPEYERLVNGFNTRNLTFPEDALSAFAGVGSRLGRKFAGGLLSGLPVQFFDLCLLWRPLRSDGLAVRRKPRVPEKALELPSWSWAGWVTEVGFWYSWARSGDLTAAPVPALVGPLRPFYRTQFFHVSDTGEETRIPCDWLDHALPFLDGNSPPDGWTRRARYLPASQTGGDLGLQDEILFFEHESDPSLAFWFPVALGEVPGPPVTAGRIRFRSTVGTFRLGSVRGCMTEVRTVDGRSAGTLWQHDETDPEYVRAVQDGGSVDLVTILGCVVSDDNQVRWGDSGMEVALEQGPARTREVYSVLWVQWDGDVAYRKGSGEVDREVWNEVVRDEQVEVTLC